MNLRNSTSTGAARGKVLVTGGAGFVGANLVRLLREEGTATSILQVCEVLEDVLGRDIERRFVGSRLGDVQASLSNSHQASEQMAWEPKFGLREGLRHTVAYYQGVLSEEREPMK